MSQVPDAWDDEWSTAVDDSAQGSSEVKKPTAKQTKAQKRAAQAEFNRQLWAEAEGPRETNYFLESRNVVPFKQEFKPPPVLLSRKGPIVQKPRPAPTPGIEALSIKDKEESSEDEDETVAQQKALDAAKIQAAKEREEKQRKYEERRLELFGADAGSASGRPNSRSGGSSPANLTPPGSRSSTPHRGGKRGRGRANNTGTNSPRLQQQPGQQQKLRPQSEVFEPGHSARPMSMYLARREQDHETAGKVVPTREPRAPDGTPGFRLQRRSLVADSNNTVIGH